MRVEVIKTIFNLQLRKDLLTNIWDRCSDKWQELLLAEYPICNSKE